MAEVAEAPVTPAVAEVAPQAQPSEQQSTAVPLSPQAEQVAQILDMASKDPVFAAKPEVADLVKRAEEIKQKKNANIPSEEANDAAPEDGAVENKSVFFAKKTAPLVEFKTTDDYSKYIEERFGVKDPAKFFQSANKWREDAQQLNEVSDRATGLEKVITDLPDPIYEAIQEYYRAGDWVGVLKGNLPQFDYSKPFEKQVVQVVNHYFPGKFTEEEITDNDDSVVTNAIDVAKEKYNLKKEQLDNQRAITLENADKKAKAIKESVSGSVEKLEESFPEFDTRKRSEIKQIMLGGDLNGLFFKKDGTFKPEAAEMLALALYGKDAISGRVTKAKNKAASEAKTEVIMENISRGRDKPGVVGGQYSESPQIPAQVNDLLRKVNKPNFY